MAPTTLDELTLLLTKHGLPLDLADHAVAGLALVGGGAGRSKLGGRPEIPGSWPTNNGRGLTHLASIALDELPAGPWRATLPEAFMYGDAGTISFWGGPDDIRSARWQRVKAAPDSC